jgi:hypothetical protein
MMAGQATAGAAMKSVITLFTLAALAITAAIASIAAWTGHIGPRDPNLRAIHYDTSYDLSARRRTPAE